MTATSPSPPREGSPCAPGGGGGACVCGGARLGAHVLLEGLGAVVVAAAVHAAPHVVPAPLPQRPPPQPGHSMGTVTHLVTPWSRPGHALVVAVTSLAHHSASPVHLVASLICPGPDTARTPRAASASARPLRAPARGPFAAAAPAAPRQENASASPPDPPRRGPGPGSGSGRGWVRDLECGAAGLGHVERHLAAPAPAAGQPPRLPPPVASRRSQIPHHSTWSEGARAAQGTAGPCLSQRRRARAEPAPTDGAPRRDALPYAAHARRSAAAPRVYGRAVRGRGSRRAAGRAGGR